MTLTLEIVGSQAKQLGPAARKEFIRAGGSIGRAQDNDWVIPDPYISGHHARIHFKDGGYLLEDTSTNGVYLKRCGTRLRKGQLHALESGQQICLDQLEISILISAPALPDSTLIKPIQGQAVSNNIVPPSSKAQSRQAAADYDDATELLPPELILPEALSSLSPSPSPSPSPLRSAANAAKTPPRQMSPDPAVSEAMKFAQLARAPERTHEARRLPQPGAAAQFHPHDFETNGREIPVKAKAVREEVKAENPTKPTKPTNPEERADFAALLAEAGIPQSAATPELARTLGRVLRTMTAGMLEALHEREELKATLQLQLTSFKKTENNPLKFSANLDDALHNLFVKHNPAYLGAEAAFEQGLRDLHSHQLAMLNALRASFESVLNNFDPDRLQAQFGKKKRSFFPNARYWNQFRTHYRTLVCPTGRFDERLFADEFARAYSEQARG